MPGSVVLRKQLPQSPNAMQISVEESIRLQSGKWVGHFKDPRFFADEETWPMDIFLVAKNKTQFWGFGIDDVDPFTINSGTSTGQAIKFVKVYRSHVIYYSGHLNEYGTFISGMWSFNDTPHGEGTFSIWRQPV